MAKSVSAWQESFRLKIKDTIDIYVLILPELWEIVGHYAIELGKALSLRSVAFTCLSRFSRFVRSTTMW